MGYLCFPCKGNHRSGWEASGGSHSTGRVTSSIQKLLSHLFDLHCQDWDEVRKGGGRSVSICLWVLLRDFYLSMWIGGPSRRCLRGSTFCGANIIWGVAKASPWPCRAETQEVLYHLQTPHVYVVQNTSPP